MRNIGTIKKQLEQQLRDLGAKVEEIEDDLRTPRSASLPLFSINEIMGRQDILVKQAIWQTFALFEVRTFSTE